jgi:hypothetical protein
MRVISASDYILTYKQVDRIKLKCRIQLDHLFPDQKTRNRFDDKWIDFIEDSCNDGIYRLRGDTLSYDSEQLIPTKTDGRPSLLLVLGNPASESIKRGMFFATVKDGKELPFWKHIIEKSELLSTPTGDDLSAGALNHSRKRQLSELRYETPFRLGLSVFISMPSAAGGKWSGVAGIHKLLGAAAFRLMEKEEIERITGLARKFVQNNGAVVTFQKNAWENLRSENDPVYGIDRAKNGKLAGRLKGNSKIRLFGVPPTRLVGPCCDSLRRIKKEIEGRNY